MSAVAVLGVHLVGGLVGTLLISLFASSSAPAGVSGLFYGGGLDQLGKQAAAAGAVFGYSLLVTLVLAALLKVTLGFRLPAQREIDGIDEAEHAESAYHFREDSRARRATATATSATQLSAPEEHS